MDRNSILRQILSDEALRNKYEIKNVDVLTTNAPYSNKLVEVLSVAINDHDNNLSDTQIYKKIKNIHNIA